MEQSELDPIATLQVPSPVASVAFLAQDGGKDSSSSSDDDDDDDDEFLTSRCAQLQQEGNHANSSFLALQNQKVVSLHKDGSCHLWDLTKKTIEATIATNRTESERGLAVRRINSNADTNSECLMIQTQQGEGSISIHATDRVDFPIVAEYATFSQSFCQAAPCSGRPQSPLLGVPYRQENTAMIWDIRDPKPVTVIPISDEGMMTSLALTLLPGTGRPVLGCGMESGSLLLYDFTSGSTTTATKSKVSLSKDPILTMDMLATTDDSILSITGLAGDRVEEQEMDHSERGRIAVVKASHVNHTWEMRLRARLSTCRVHERSLGKPGVSICRFRPDGKVWAVGGWDYRVRLFDSSTLSPLGILRGHKSSVTALDFAEDAAKSGLLATSGTENIIHIWRCLRT